MPQVYNPNNIVKNTGNTRKDINIAIGGYKYPDRVYGHKFNHGYDNTVHRPKVSN